jgi:hypothetical protein
MYEGSEIMYEGSEVTHDGLEVTHEGLEVTHEGIEVTHEGIEVTHEGLEVTHEGIEVTHRSSMILVSKVGVIVIEAWVSMAVVHHNLWMGPLENWQIFCANTLKNVFRNNTQLADE